MNDDKIELPPEIIKQKRAAEVAAQCYKCKYVWFQKRGPLGLDPRIVGYCDATSGQFIRNERQDIREKNKSKYWTEHEEELAKRRTRLPKFGREPKRGGFR